MTAPAYPLAACAICGRPLDQSIAEMRHSLEARVAYVLRRLHPGWAADDGPCPECVQRAVSVLRRKRSATSLHGDLQLSYPVYARHEAALIPTPLRVHANPAFTGKGVTLAFLDSGFYPHPDLTEPVDRIRAHIDATLAQPAEHPHFRRAEVASWHGLMVACIAAGNGRQSGGIYRGIAPEADLVLVKTGNRRNRRIPDRDIVRALQWVLENHDRYAIRLVNLSIGGDVPSNGAMTPLDALVEEAVAHGLVVVAAVGNGGVNRVIPPASAPSVIAVGGVDDQNSLNPRFRRMWRSSYGRGVSGVPKPDLIAPAIWVAAPMLPRTWVHNEARLLWALEQAPEGELAQLLKTPAARARLKAETLGAPPAAIRAAIRRRIVEQKYIHPHYQHVDGSSMAAPIVSGVAAQMLEANPALSPAQVKAILTETAQPLAFVPRLEQGAGVVEAARAVAAALRAPGGPLAGLPVSPHFTGEGIGFVCRAPGAREVALVASFNGWQPTGAALREVRPGVWVGRAASPPPGLHAYKFLIDRTRWVQDVENPAQVEDGYGGFHSLLKVA